MKFIGFRPEMLARARPRACRSYRFNMRATTMLLSHFSYGILGVCKHTELWNVEALLLNLLGDTQW